MDRKWWTLVAVCVATFMLLLDITIVNVALPDIADATCTSSFSDLQWVIDAYALSLAALLLTAGSLADLLGRRRVFVVGLGDLHGGVAAVRPVGRRRWCSNLARALQGVGGAAMFATSLALLAAGFHGPRARHRVRHLGRDDRRRGRRRPARRRRADRGRRLAVDLLRQRADRHRRDRRHARDGRRVERPGRARRRLAGLVTFSGALFLLVFALVRGNAEGWGSTLIVGAPRRRGRAARRVRGRRARASATRCSTSRCSASRRSPGASIAAFALSASMFSMFLYLTLYMQNVARLLAAGGGPALPAGDAALVLRRADRGQALDAVPVRLLIGGGPGARGRRAAADARPRRRLGLDGAAARLPVRAAPASA